MLAPPRPSRIAAAGTEHVTDRMRFWLWRDSSEECRSRAAVLEHVPYHAELLLSAVHLLKSAGARCVDVLWAATSDGGRPRGEYGMLDQVITAGAAVLTGRRHIAHLLRKQRLQLLLVSTFECGLIVNESAPPSCDHTLLHLLRAAGSSAMPPRVLAGCHNVDHCASLLRFARLKLRELPMIPLAYNIAMRRALATRHGEDAVEAMPVYFGEMTAARRGVL